MKQILFIITSFLVINLSGACSIRKSNNGTNNAGVLWQISGNGLRDTSYLLGTMHNIESAFLNEIPLFSEIFTKVENVATESDYLEQISSSNAQSRISPEYIFMPRDSSNRLLSYKSLFDKEIDYRFVDSVLRAQYHPRYFLYKPKYWLDCFAIRETFKNFKKENTSVQMMDFFILSEAYRQQKKRFTLESTEEIYNTLHVKDSLLYAHISLQEQAKDLFSALKKNGIMGDVFDYKTGLENAYRKQNFDSIAKYFLINDEKTKNQYPEDSSNMELADSIFEMIGANRNRKWMKKIPGIMQQGSTLIAVGFGHLVGEEGLIALLRKDGYKVGPVK